MSHDYDYIVIGAGSAGCAVAARLAATSSVLLVEAGGHSRRLSVKAPAAFPKQFHGPLDWDYWTAPEPHLNGRMLHSPRGRMLGGSSGMNALIYLRGNRLDYDSWASHGAEGWSYDDVLPVFRRGENNRDIHDSYHGSTGPQHVRRITDIDPVTLALIDAAAGTGVRRNPDFNGAVQDGTGAFQVIEHNGARFTSADAYLTPLRNNRSLTIRSKTLVHRIILDNGRALGVEVQSGNGPVERIHARGEVIVSGGAFNTPAVLQHSGIGDPELLSPLGIPTNVSLPAVGQNLMEHPLTYVTFELKKGYTGLHDISDPRHLARWLLRRRGKLTSNIAEGGIHIRTESTMPAPNFQIVLSPSFFYQHGAQAWEVPAATMALSYLTPSSRGTVRIASADPSRKPVVTYNMFSRDHEFTEMIDGIEYARDVAANARRAGVIGDEITPGPAFPGRDGLRQWIRTTAQHTYHPACSARMGTPEDGVVDARLKVHGVENLRVADTSVMPTVIRGNTHAPAAMIGERCADFIIQDRS